MRAPHRVVRVTIPCVCVTKSWAALRSRTIPSVGVGTPVVGRWGRRLDSTQAPPVWSTSGGIYSTNPVSPAVMVCSSPVLYHAVSSAGAAWSIAMDGSAGVSFYGWAVISFALAVCLSSRKGGGRRATLLAKLAVARFQSTGPSWARSIHSPAAVWNHRRGGPSPVGGVFWRAGWTVSYTAVTPGVSPSSPYFTSLLGGLSVLRKYRCRVSRSLTGGTATLGSAAGRVMISAGGDGAGADETGQASRAFRCSRRSSMRVTRSMVRGHEP